MSSNQNILIRQIAYVLERSSNQGDRTAFFSSIAYYFSARENNYLLTAQSYWCIMIEKDRIETVIFGRQACNEIIIHQRVISPKQSDHSSSPENMV